MWASAPCSHMNGRVAGRRQAPIFIPSPLRAECLAIIWCGADPLSNAARTSDGQAVVGRAHVTVELLSRPTSTAGAPGRSSEPSLLPYHRRAVDGQLGPRSSRILDRHTSVLVGTGCLGPLLSGDLGLLTLHCSLSPLPVLQVLGGPSPHHLALGSDYWAGISESRVPLTVRSEFYEGCGSR